MTDQGGLRPDQEAEQPAPDVEQMMQLVQFARQCEDGWRQWFAATRIRPCQVFYEDLVRTGSPSRTEFSNITAARNSMQTTFRPSAIASSR